MNMLGKTGNKEGRPRTKFACFAERVARLDINPVYRSDFIGELKGGCCEVTEDNNNNVLNVCISGDNVEILGKPDGLLWDSAKQKEEEALLQERIHEQLKSTYFESALKYWKGRNLSKDFAACASRLHPYIGSLPHLILHLEKVIDVLLEFISLPNSLAHEPVYHILSVLARVRRKNSFCDLNMIAYVFFAVFVPGR